MFSRENAEFGLSVVKYTRTSNLYITLPTKELFVKRKLGRYETG